jgi:SPP1 family predicted phage head-tail adaptor
MQAGKLRHRIIIQKQTLGAADAYGEPARTWSTWAGRWSSIEPISGREIQYARSFAGTVSHKITLRHLDVVATTYRVKFGSRTFAINAVITPREVKDELWLFCTESTDPAPQ